MIQDNSRLKRIDKHVKSSGIKRPVQVSIHYL